MARRSTGLGRAMARAVGRVACGAALLAPGLSLAQDNPAPAPVPGSTSIVTAITSIELWLAGAIIGFGVLVLTMQFLLLRRTPNTTPEDILRLFTVTMIVVGTMALIAIGYSSQQISPALGLFGTLLGYLLGKTDERMRARAASRAGEAPDRPAGG